MRQGGRADSPPSESGGAGTALVCRTRRSEKTCEEERAEDPELEPEPGLEEEEDPEEEERSRLVAATAGGPADSLHGHLLAPKAPCLHQVVWKRWRWGLVGKVCQRCGLAVGVRLVLVEVFLALVELLQG